MRHVGEYFSGRSPNDLLLYAIYHNASPFRERRVSGSSIAKHSPGLKFFHTHVNDGESQNLWFFPYLLLLLSLPSPSPWNYYSYLFFISIIPKVMSKRAK